MSSLRAFAMRYELPRRPQRRESDAADLSTFLQRASGSLAADALHVAPPKQFWTPLAGPISGRLIEGTLPEDHFARFSLRLPREWNGGLVAAAASGITDERTYDLYFADYALSRGFAFAATDKGVRRAVLDNDTVLMPHVPENSIRRWSSRLEALARAAQAECRAFYGRPPRRTYAVGLSNGGYIARRALEGRSDLFDGGLEVSGVMWRADRGNLLRELPVALRATSSRSWDRAALTRAGFPAGDRRWDPLIAFYRQLYWEAVMHLFLGDVDPAYSGPVEEYDLDARPASVREAIRTFENTGDLQAPLISIAGAHDYLISCAGHALAYADLVRSRGRADRHKLILIEDASHIDTNRETFEFVRPLMTHAHAAFEQLVSATEGEAAAATAPSSRRPR